MRVWGGGACHSS